MFRDHAIGMRIYRPWVLLLVAVIAWSVLAGGSQAATPAEAILKTSGIAGGLCVEVGCSDTKIAAELARTGRFLVERLDADAETVDRTRRELDSQGIYGLVSVDRWESGGKLPYAENLVNLLMIGDRAAGKLPLTEAVRVVCPGGFIFIAGEQVAEAALSAAGLENVQTVPAGGQWVAARKPRPAEMDQWTHSRHGADGNAVSLDTLVGPPRRVRWVTGPVRENSRMISSAGRNFYADLLARDSFNGLRLWERPLKPSGRSAAPVAAGELVFAFSDKTLLALDGATGNTVREFPEAGTPSDLLHVEGTLLAVDGQSVRAWDAKTGQPRWKHEAARPQYVVAGDGAVYLLQGDSQRGEKLAAVSLDLASGKVRWQKDDFPWVSKVRRCVYHRGLLAYEVSTFNDDGEGNLIHIVSAADGKPLWNRAFVPGMNHRKQARAMFIGEELWILHNGKHGTPSHCSALDPQTGEVKVTHDAGLCHCFPPVATARYMFAGEMELTDLKTGQVDANRITKAACSRDGGWVPANGLIYVFPKHCVCWPMLRGYAALAGALPESDGEKNLQKIDFVLEKGVDPPGAEAASGEDQWPCYRQNAWRSGSTTATVPADLNVLWTTELGDWPADGPIAHDWRENPFVHGPVTAPVVAGGLVYVARPDAHQLVAMDAGTGAVRWRYTASGRIDTPPTIHRGLCLFGGKNGWVYCLRADDGHLVWRFRAAPNEERIVAYGQVESPWPVPGSVLVVDEVAYFAAGRQSLADGGILVFAVEPGAGKIRWVQRLDSVPQTDFYASSGLEFDNFDLLHREGDSVGMSRWLFDRATGQMTVKAKEAFALLKTGGSGAMVPRGSWTYAPRHQFRQRVIPSHLRPLVVFRDDTLLGCTQDKRSVYRRDFNLDGGEKFDPTWITGWALATGAREAKETWRSQRLAKAAKWSVPVFPEEAAEASIAAMVWAGDTVFVAGSQGGLTALSAADGKLLTRAELPAPVWDGMAAATGRLFVSTQDGKVVCLGSAGE